MPKHGFMTAKAIGIRIKAKGLGKLRFYCQMCQKQCRDANGFKCHTQSEGHLRQMSLVAQNANKYIDSFSSDFESLFLELLHRRFGEKRVFANQVYQEYIAERHHIHMNATMWSSLTTFCKYLGRTGKCKVDETERGWYIQYIDRKNDDVAGRESKRKRERAVLDDETRLERSIRKRAKQAAEAAKKRGGAEVEMKATNLVRTNSDDKIAVRLGGKKKTEKKIFGDVFRSVSSSSMKISERNTSTTTTSTKKMSAMEEILFHQTKLKQKEKELAMKKEEEMKEEERRKKMKSQEEEEEVPWIVKNIIVRVLNRNLAKGRFYKKKGVIVGTQEFVAKIEMFESGKRIRIDQDDLETVIPKLGKQVLVLSGKKKGSIAIVESLDKTKYKAILEMSNGERVRKSYDSISKWVGDE